MKPKKWARKARTLVVRLEGPGGADLKGNHRVEIRDAKKHTLRVRTLSYRDDEVAVSTIMTDLQVRLARNQLEVTDGSYHLTEDGHNLRANVALSSKGRQANR